MKALKYIASVFLLAAATLAVLYFPSFYFQKDEYEIVIEDIEQPSYDELGSGEANLMQVLTLLKDTSYKRTTIYHESEKTEADKDIETEYIKMVENVFKKYIRFVEEDIEEEDYGKFQDEFMVEQQNESEIMVGQQNESEIMWDNMFQSWIENWMNEKENWRVREITLLDLANVFSGKLINIQLYDIYFYIPDQSISMEICFSPDTKIFYTIYITDDRYFFDENVDDMYLKLYIYYKKHGESNDILEQYLNELSIYSLKNEFLICF